MGVLRYYCFNVIFIKVLNFEIKKVKIIYKKENRKIVREYYLFF